SRASIINQAGYTHNMLEKSESNEVKEDMVWIPGGEFEMGTDDPDFPDASPKHTVRVAEFYMDVHEVTNAEFAEFVEKTGYKTIAERPLDPNDFPGVAAELLVPGSAVFSPPAVKVSHDDILQWWKYEEGAFWKKPYGASTSIHAEPNHPVVHISYEDALAYCAWAGKRLPTEAEWEFAARGGKNNTKYYWGDELKPKNRWVANIFQGNFPQGNTKEDGYSGIAPVGSFPANPYGLYDMEGNVWEWCSDFYTPDYYSKSPKDNPAGPAQSFD